MLSKRPGDFEKEEVVARYLTGKSRDESARLAHVSGGFASKAIGEFTETAQNKGLENAAMEFDVEEEIDRLRRMSKFLEDNGITVEQVPIVVDTVNKVLETVSLKDLPEIVKIVKSDMSHLKAAVDLEEYERRTGKSHEAILAHVETAEERNKQLTEEAERLADEVEGLKKESDKMKQSLTEKKAALERESAAALEEHALTLKMADEVSSLKRNLEDYGIDFSDLQQLKNMVRLAHQCNSNPKEFVRLIKTQTTVKNQLMEETRKLNKTRKTTERLQTRAKKLKTKLGHAASSIAKARQLKMQGWNDESLNALSILTRRVGKPMEVLARVELLKPSIDLQAEIEKTRKENEALKKENAKDRRKALRQLRKLERGTAALLNEKVPHVLAETERVLQAHNLNLMRKYEELSSKHAILVSHCSILQSQSAEYQRRLDYAVPFSQLMWEPEKLSTNAVHRLLFEFVYPKLMIWSKNKDWEEKSDLIQKITVNALSIHFQKASNFLVSPDNATSIDALNAMLCVVAVFLPLYAALKKWFILHESKGDTGDLWGMMYHLDGFYEAFKAMAKKNKSS